MMIMRVSPTALPHLRPALRLACPGRIVPGPRHGAPVLLRPPAMWPAARLPRRT